MQDLAAWRRVDPAEGARRLGEAQVFQHGAPLEVRPRGRDDALRFQDVLQEGRHLGGKPSGEHTPNRPTKIVPA